MACFELAFVYSYISEKYQEELRATQKISCELPFCVFDTNIMLT